ncbi:hypothetical protein CYMTET_19438, partial [Cymbomonas tetramitiformis]
MAKGHVQRSLEKLWRRYKNQARGLFLILAVLVIFLALYVFRGANRKAKKLEIVEAPLGLSTLVVWKHDLEPAFEPEVFEYNVLIKDYEEELMVTLISAPKDAQVIARVLPCANDKFYSAAPRASAAELAELAGRKGQQPYAKGERIKICNETRKFPLEFYYSPPFKAPPPPLHPPRVPPALPEPPAPFIQGEFADLMDDLIRSELKNSLVAKSPPPLIQPPAAPLQQDEFSDLPEVIKRVAPNTVIVEAGSGQGGRRLLADTPEKQLDQLEQTIIVGPFSYGLSK